MTLLHTEPTHIEFPDKEVPYLKREEVMGTFNRILWESYSDTELSLRDYARELPKWRGHLCLKLPTDLWIYQELIYKTQPDVIIECGVARGGSTLFLADMCEIMNRGLIIAIDKIIAAGLPSHNRIFYLETDDVGEKVHELLAELRTKGVGQTGKGKNCLQVMVILDSDHAYEHVKEQLRIYSDYVSLGCYLIVEDGNCLGHESAKDSCEGPMRAVNEFLEHDDRFVIDPDCERFLLTYNPRGYLKKVKW